MEERPVVLVVESDVFLRSRVGQWLHRHCGQAAEVVEAAGQREAADVLAGLRAERRGLALAVMGHRLADGYTTALAQRVAVAHPAARRVLLAGEDDREPAERLAGELGLDGCVTDRDLAPLALVLADRAVGAVQVVGRRFDARAYEVKDCLSRNMVPFAWHDVDSSPAAAAFAARLGLPRPVPTAVVLADGRVLRDPTPVLLATALELTDPASRSTYDLVVVGGGPAGLAAAVYGACEGLDVVVVEDDAPGGQAGSTSRIENYLGFPGGLTGADLARRALEQARRFGVQWLLGRRATGLGAIEGDHVVRLDDGAALRAGAVLVTTGMRWRRLAVPGAEALVNRGVYYGASLAEAAQTAGEDVHVVGAGNSAGQAALYFADRARSVQLLVRGDSLAGSPMSSYLVERIEAHPSITVRTATEVVEVVGEERLSALVLRDLRAGATRRVPASSVYVLIGMAPCTEWLGEAVALDSRGFVLTGAQASSSGREAMITETSVPGVFAAGDVCAGTVKRVGVAVGQGAMAIQVIAQHLRDRAAHGPRPVRQFDLLDADGSGHIEERDLSAVARRLVAGFGEPAGSDRAQRVLTGYADFWRALAAPLGAVADQRISRAAFEAATRRLAEQSALFDQLAEAVVALCDTDDDGAVNQAEFEKVLRILGVPTREVGGHFRALDADGSGYLDRREIAEALKRFYAGAALLAAPSAQSHHGTTVDPSPAAAP